LLEDIINDFFVFFSKIKLVDESTNDFEGLGPFDLDNEKDHRFLRLKKLIEDLEKYTA
jgi:hypothetical protein